ncbi:MAG: 26S proteasome non-ATPase regulatory subunit [Caeruleum heppii]|nr:MAG: 26S proteasome non-ATPase regulatory subunit [Caeruleum heppii]
MVDKRALRSSKSDSSTTSNGDTSGKNTSTSNGSAKQAPSRNPSTRTRSAAASKKGPAATGAKATDDDADESPHTNGFDPTENGVNGTNNQDVDMDDDPSQPPDNPKADKNRDGDDKMTVVVPPSKGAISPVEKGKGKDDDVNMTDSTNAEASDPLATEVKVDPFSKAISDIRANFPLLERAVAQFDPRFSLRALRSISSVRKQLTADVLARVITETYQPSSTTAQSLLSAIGKDSESFDRPNGASEMDVDSESKSQPGSSTTKNATPKDVIAEIDVYLCILIQIHLLDAKSFDAGAKFSDDLIQRIRSHNRRTLDALSARAYFYLSLFYEQLAPLPPSPSSPVVSIRQPLLAALRTAVLRKDTDIQATVTTLLLRNYLSTSHISQADLLVSHTQFPPAASNNQIARFLYYLGRIRAIQLSYTEAHEHLTGATRKSPTSTSAAGFYQAAMKFLIVVELLMGDIPDRGIFRQANLERALQPYFLLVQGVRVGSQQDFLHTVQTYSSNFRRDGTYTLILRLRQNVIRTGIRVMSLSYSRISLRDICGRLLLDSEQSAEYIVAKAIRDGVIEATLDHENAFMKSKEVGDVYATREPGEAFHDRIRACLDLHDESVKAMRFPMHQHRSELKNAQEARDRERELAKEIQEGGDIDEDDAGGDFEGI